ncbi:hypothetical protein BJ165DRAFT_1514574 [Panaeolus papilionaceus]|nr:hypothetical protein BJ165DRAFT_1514574 [Panaeolus papilionaceus]
MDEVLTFYDAPSMWSSPFRVTHVGLSFLPPISGHLVRLLNLITNAKRPHARPQPPINPNPKI